MQIEAHDSVLLVRMQAGKANAIGPAFLSAFEELWAEFQRSDAAAAVLTGSGASFSAGLDLVTLADFGRAEMRSLMAHFHRVMLSVFESDRPVVAALNGHAIAGGCVLALQTDWRVLTEQGAKIGLNEAQLGLGLPVCVVESLRARIPADSFSEAALVGALFESPEALRRGLVDELAPAERVVPRALECALRLARTPRASFAAIKRSWHAPFRAAMAERFEADLEVWLDTWFSDDARGRLAQALETLRAR